MVNPRLKLTDQVKFDIMRGLYVGREYWLKFGTDPAVANGGLGDIWGPGTIYTWPTAAETIRIKAGGNAADTADGDGAREVTVTCLDDDFNQVDVVLSTLGALASLASTQTVRRILRAEVTGVGLYGAKNTAAINIENTTAEDVLAFIGAGVSQTEMTHFTVKAGWMGYITRIHADAPGAKPSEHRLFTRENADVIAAPFQSPKIKHHWAELAGSSPEYFDGGIICPEKTDIWGDALGKGAVSSASMDYDIFMFQNDA